MLSAFYYFFGRFLAKFKNKQAFYHNLSLVFVLYIFQLKENASGLQINRKGKYCFEIFCCLSRKDIFEVIMPYLSQINDSGLS